MKALKLKFVVLALVAAFGPMILAGCASDELKPEPEDPRLKDMPKAPEDATMGDGPGGAKKGN